MNTMTNPDNPDVRRVELDKITLRIYEQGRLDVLDAYAAAHGLRGRPRATDALLALGERTWLASRDSAAGNTPAAPVAGISQISSATEVAPIAGSGAAPMPAAAAVVAAPPAPAASPVGNTVGNRLGIALGGLALAVATTALCVALLRTSATTANPTAAAPATVTPAEPATPPDLSYATKADLDATVKRIDGDLDVIGGLIQDLQKADKRQTERLLQLSPAIPAKPTGSPGR